MLFFLFFIFSPSFFLFPECYLAIPPFAPLLSYYYSWDFTMYKYLMVVTISFAPFYGLYMFTWGVCMMTSLDYKYQNAIVFGKFPL